jgi:lysophospholipase L1-like esterase
LKWIFTGDSITAGVEHTHGYRSYPEIFGERIRFEMGRSRDIVINTAISGNVLQDILTDFDWRVAQFKPAVVSLMIGTNDCARSGTNTDIFKRELETFLARIRKGGGIPILQTPNIIINERAAERAHLSAYVAVIQDIAKEEQVILVDNWRNWQDTLQKHPEVNVYKNWLNDPLHPNGTGHNEIARSLFKELSIFDPAAATCGGKYYEGEH